MQEKVLTGRGIGAGILPCFLRKSDQIFKGNRANWDIWIMCLLLMPYYFDCSRLHTFRIFLHYTLQDWGNCLKLAVTIPQDAFYLFFCLQQYNEFELNVLSPQPFGSQRSTAQIVLICVCFYSFIFTNGFILLSVLLIQSLKAAVQQLKHKVTPLDSLFVHLLHLPLWSQLRFSHLWGQDQACRGCLDC